MELNTLLIGLYVLIGIAARVFVPWLSARQAAPNDPELKWNWNQLWPQLIAVLINVLILPLTIPDFSALQGGSYQVLFLAGWGAADIGAEFASQYRRRN